VAFAGNSFIACKDDPGICPGPGWQSLSTNKLEPGPLILTSNDVASASFSADVAPIEREHSSFGRAPWISSCGLPSTRIGRPGIAAGLRTELR
jgi:hypothetical protein